MQVKQLIEVLKKADPEWNVVIGFHIRTRYGKKQQNGFWMWTGVEDAHFDSGSEVEIQTSFQIKG
jgi:hypothetical protein